MASSIVIKVQYEETLRRICPSVHDNKLSLDFCMLKEKIRGLFDFAPGAVFTMTYEDEDGDIVTLGNDDDIHDIMQQSLDPLRITVELSHGNPPTAGGSNSAPALPQNYSLQYQPQLPQQQLSLLQRLQQQQPSLIQQQQPSRIQQQLALQQLRLQQQMPYHQQVPQQQAVLGNANSSGSTNSVEAMIS